MHFFLYLIVWTIFHLLWFRLYQCIKRIARTLTVRHFDLIFRKAAEEAHEFADILTNFIPASSFVSMLFVADNIKLSSQWTSPSKQSSLFDSYLTFHNNFLSHYICIIHRNGFLYYRNWFYFFLYNLCTQRTLLSQRHCLYLVQILC